MTKRKRAAKDLDRDNALLPQVNIKLIKYLSHYIFQKKHYRQRAHANPFSDHSLLYPSSPHTVDWSAHYPAFAGTGQVPQYADIGCGFGGLLINLAPIFPNILMLGLFEPRTSPTDYSMIIHRHGNSCSGLTIRP